MFQFSALDGIVDFVDNPAVFVFDFFAPFLVFEVVDGLYC